MFSELFVVMDSKLAKFANFFCYRLVKTSIEMMHVLDLGGF